MSIHSWFRPGQRILLIMKDKRRIVSRFVERTRDHVVLRRGKYRIRDIRNASIYDAEAARRKS